MNIRWAFIFTVSLLLGLRPTVGYSQILIGDDPLKPSDVLTSASLVGYRAFPINGLVFLHDKKKWAVKANVLYDAALTDRHLHVQTGLSPEGINALSLDQLVSLYEKNATPETTCQVENGRSSTCTIAKLNGLSDTAAVVSYGKNTKLDANIVARAFASGAFQVKGDNYVSIDTNDNPRKMGIVVNTDFATTANKVYSSANKFANSLSSPNAAFDFGNATQIAIQNNTVGAATAVVIDTVDIGNPIILTAADQRLRPPRSIVKRFDVYLLQFALNPKTDLRTKFDELSFFISLHTANSEALELVPIRYGDEQNITTKEGMPSVKVEGGGVGVEVGQIYGQEVSYKALKPTIVGTGLQASKFGWSLSNEMLDMSAKRLIAVIGVPKKTRKIKLDMVLSAKTKSQAYGWIEGNVASSAPVAFLARLPD